MKLSRSKIAFRGACLPWCSRVPSSSSMKNFHGLKVCSFKTLSPYPRKAALFFSNAPNKLEDEHLSHSKCWKCGQRQSCCHLFCSGCGKIQPVGGSCCNYFKLLDMYVSHRPYMPSSSQMYDPSVFFRPVGFKVDEKSLEQNYKNIQKVTHPDRYSMASEVFFFSLLSSDN
jgi:hypothetical protein